VQKNEDDACIFLSACGYDERLNFIKMLIAATATLSFSMYEIPEPILVYFVTA